MFVRWTWGVPVRGPRPARRDAVMRRAACRAHERGVYQSRGHRRQALVRDGVDGQDPRAVRGDGQAVLEVGRQVAVHGAHRPTVVVDADLVPTEREHRLDGQAEADLEPPPARGRGGSWGPGAPRASRSRCRVRRRAARRRGPPRARRPRRRAEMSPMWLPGTAAAMPAIAPPASPRRGALLAPARRRRRRSGRRPHASHRRSRRRRRDERPSGRCAWRSGCRARPRRRSRRTASGGRRPSGRGRR